MEFKKMSMSDIESSNKMKNNEYSVLDSINLKPGLTLLIGLSGSGKTRLSCAISVSIYFGIDPFNNKKLEKPYIHTSWIEFEYTKEKLITRIKTACDGLNKDYKDYLYEMPYMDSEMLLSTFSNSNIFDQSELIKCRFELKKELFNAIEKAPTDVIIIDNLQPLCGILGIDPNSEMAGIFLRELRLVAQKSNKIVIVLHHGAKIDQTVNRGITSGSGSQSINNAVENIYLLSTDEHGISKLENTKSSEEKSETIYFTFECDNKRDWDVSSGLKIKTLSNYITTPENIKDKIIKLFPETEITPTSFSRNIFKGYKNDMSRLFEELKSDGLIKQLENKKYILTDLGISKKEKLMSDDI